jgi:hypothetical protein
MVLPVDAVGLSGFLSFGWGFRAGSSTDRRFGEFLGGLVGRVARSRIRNARRLQCVVKALR